MSWSVWIVAAASGLAGAGVAIFNTMVRRKNAVLFAAASVDSMLMKRYDLIPNLVAVCKAYRDYESTVLTEITALRTQGLALRGEDAFDVNGKLTGRLQTAVALAESYPELKASEHFDLLSRSLNEVEAQIAAARRTYNAAVFIYNNGCEMFPTSLVASAMGYRLRRPFEISEAERAPAQVKT